MSEENTLETRKKALQGKRKKPTFTVWNIYKYKRIADTWRKPRGKTSKLRRGNAGRPPSPNPGYGAPKNIRGLHPTGYEEILVRNANDLETVNPKIQAVRFAAKLGAKKKKVLQETALKNKIKVLNPLKK